MTCLRKRMKLGARLNLFFLVATYFFCYFITPGDILGVCEECSKESSMSLFFGTSTLVIQGIIGLVMFCSAKKMDKTHNTEAVAASLLISIVLSFIQMAVMSETTLKVSGHGVFTGVDLNKIKILEHQFDIGKVIMILLVVFYIAMIAMVTGRSAQPKKNVREKEILIVE